MLEKFKQKNHWKVTAFIIGFVLFNVAIILTTLLVAAGIPTITGPKGVGIIAWSSQAWSNAGEYLINQIYLNNFFKQPPLVLGFLTLIGYLIMGRGWKESILGALKTAIGFVLLTIGSGTIVGVSKVVFLEISKIGGTNIVPLDPYLGWTSANDFFKSFNYVNDYLSLITYVFVGSFVVNIILVALKKWTNVHSLMITGHVMFQQAAIITTALYVILFRQIPLIGGAISNGAQVGLVVITSLFLGSYWGIGSTATYKPTNLLTDNAGFAIGHQQMLGIALSYNLSKHIGNKDKSAENQQMPKWLKIFEDNVFVQTLIITVLFLILIIILISVKPNDYIKDGQFINGLASWNGVFSGAHWTINIFGGSLKIVAGLLAMITGVRMFVTELQQSFQGISEKLIPGAVVAIDIAAVYGFAPNSVTFGFVSGTIGQFIGVGIVIAISVILGSMKQGNTITIVVPLFVTLFFSSGAIGPYANLAGGVRATMLVPAILGLIEILVISFALSALSHASSEINVISPIPGGINQESWDPNPFKTGYIGMADWNLFFGAMMLVSSYFSILGYIFVPLCLIGMYMYGFALDSGKQIKKTWLQSMLKLKPQLVTKE